MKFSISVSTLIANLIDPTFETNLNKKKKNDLFIPIKPNYSTYSKYIYTHRFFMFVKPPFGFHRDKITLTTSQLKKKKKRKKKRRNSTLSPIKIQRAPFACRENSTSSTSPCQKSFPIPRKRGEPMAWCAISPSEGSVEIEMSVKKRNGQFGSRKLERPRSTHASLSVSIDSNTSVGLHRWHNQYRLIYL